jgi:hypothetical protein
VSVRSRRNRFSLPLLRFILPLKIPFLPVRTGPPRLFFLTKSHSAVLPKFFLFAVFFLCGTRAQISVLAPSGRFCRLLVDPFAGLSRRFSLAPGVFCLFHFPPGCFSVLLTFSFGASPARRVPPALSKAWDFSSLLRPRALNFVFPDFLSTP